MKKYFSVSEAAKMVHMTSETLRYYDRICLVKPSRKDEWTKYRYYTEQDIVRLNTIHALQQMDLSLNEIKAALELKDLEKIVDFFNQAEKRADIKIAELEYSKSKIQAARADYEKKLCKRKHEKRIFEKEFPQRVIMLSETLESPSLDNLWNYLSNFYDEISPDNRDQYDFEDLAGIYTECGISRMFAQCIRYGTLKNLKILPAGMYLCAECTQNDKDTVYNEVMCIAKEKYGAAPDFTIQQIVVSGILHWNYQIQIPVQCQ